MTLLFVWSIKLGILWSSETFCIRFTQRHIFMRSYTLQFFVILFVLDCFGCVSGSTSLSSKTQVVKLQKIPMGTYSKTETLENITSKVVNETRRSEVPSLTTQSVKDLYHEAYLLLRDVKKALKLKKIVTMIKRKNKPKQFENRNASANEQHTFSEAQIQNKTPFRQTTSLAQSSLPLFNTRKKISYFNDGSKNSSSAKQTIIKKLNQADGYVKIAALNQANFILFLLKNHQNRFRLDGNFSTIMKNQLPRKKIAMSERKYALLLQRDARNKSSLKNNSNVDVTKMHPYNIHNKVISPSDFQKLKDNTYSNTNSARLDKTNYSNDRLQSFLSGSSIISSEAQAFHNSTTKKQNTSSSFRQFNQLTNDIVEELGGKRENEPDNTCSTGNVKYNQTLILGIKAGYFTEEARAKTIEDCIYHCCSRNTCDVAFMLKESCFLVKCHNKSSCSSRQARSFSFNPRLVHVFHHDQHAGRTQFLPKNNEEPFSESDFEHHKVNSSHKSRLFSAGTKSVFEYSPPESGVFIRGLKAGNFTSQGEVKNMNECIQHCGEQIDCSAAFMVRHICFTVTCQSNKSCDTAPAVITGYNPSVSFVTHFLTARKDNEEEREKDQAKPLTALQVQVQVNSKKSLKVRNNALKTPTFKHSFPESRVFVHGLKAGNFTSQGEVTNMDECIRHCGQQISCSAAFMVRHICFTVTCHSKKSCDTAPAAKTGYNPRVSFVTHFTPSMTSQPASLHRCKRKKIYENVTLFGGINAGIFLDFGEKENMSECIDECCRQKHCDVAFMLENDCYGVQCKTKQLCGTTPAKHVKKYRPRLAHIKYSQENESADSHSLSSCWNGEILVNYTLAGGIDAGIFYSNGNTDTMRTCMKYCCEQHDCDLALHVNQGCYTVHCKNEDQCRARQARKTSFIPQIAFKRPVKNEGTLRRLTESVHKSCQIGETHFNATLKMGLHSGVFKKLARVVNMEDCVEMCCKEMDIDAAFMLGNLCYSVKCYNIDLCQIRPAFISNINIVDANPTVAFIRNSHKDNELELSTSSSHCPRESLNALHVFNNKTLLGGFETGNYTFFGKLNNMQLCIQECCSLGRCDVAYSIDGNCYGIECFSRNLCHLDDRVSDFTNTQISIIKNFKIDWPKKISRYKLPTISGLLLILVLMAWLYWKRLKK